jgi:diguanylate cyclase (GGDEF)-like protein
LRLEKYEITQASDAKEALAFHKLERADLILVRVPDPAGAVRQLRSDPTCVDTPILVLLEQGSDVVPALSAGADDVVPVSAESSGMIAKIRGQLTRFRGDTSLAASDEVVWDWNPNTGQLHVGEQWGALVGSGHVPQPGRLGDWLDRVHPADLLALRDAISEQCQNPRTYFLNEHRLLHSSGVWRWVRVRGTAARDADGNVMCLAGSMADITATKVADSLTGLPNRLHFLEHLSLAIETSKGSGARPCVLFVDLDRFKNVNDSLGHLVGDQLLAEVADRLRAALRSGDLVARQPDRISMARFGGDEFVVLVHGLRDPRDAGPIAQRILDALAEPFVLGGRTTYMTASIGIATWNSSYRTPYDLLRDADTAMYRAKQAGKNRYEVFEDAHRAQAVHRLNFENELRRAVGGREFSLAWQPIIDLETGATVAVEVLLRWPGFHLGECRLEEVIQVAEETGLIFELGRWVLDNACLEMAALRASGEHLGKLILNVNVSAKQLLAPLFYEGVMEALRNSGLPADALKLEVTESVMIADASHALDVLQRLKCASVKLGIDDFGTGFSSLSYLHQFPFDTLKLDRSFLTRSQHKGKTFEVVRAVIQLAHALGMDVVAEGVEAAEQAQALRGLGCEFGQGYHFARPMSTKQIQAFLGASVLAGASQ